MSGICLPIDAVSGSPSFPAAQHRVALAALMCGRSDRPLGAAGGIRPGSAPVATVTATTWSLTPFLGYIDPGTALTVGPYLFAFLADESGSIDAADASNPRIDRLDVQVPDDPAGASPLSAQVVYTVGTPASTPSAPAAPARSIPLFQINVPAAGTGSPSTTSTWLRAVAAGGILPVRNSGEYPANAPNGQHVDDASLGQLLRWTGSTWRAYLPVCYRKVTGTGTFNTTANTAHPVTSFTGGSSSDQANIGDISYSAGVFTVGSAGSYRWDATVVVPTNSGVVGVSVLKDGATVNSGEGFYPNLAHTTAISPGGTLQLAAGDTVQLRVISLDQDVTGFAAQEFSLQRIA